MKELTSNIEAEVHYARLDAVLTALSATQTTLTYRELGKCLGIFSARLAAMLGRRMEDDHANGLPLSSALIVNRATGRSSPGFFEMARSLGYAIQEEEQFWKDQVYACFSQFAEVTISMMLNSGLSDAEQEKVERLDQAIASAMIDAGVTSRASWSGETVNGRRVIRLRIGDRVVMQMREDEFSDVSDEQLLAQLKSRLG